MKHFALTWYLFLELKGILNKLGLAARYSSMSRKGWQNLIMAISEALPTACHATTCDTITHYFSFTLVRKKRKEGYQ